MKKFFITILSLILISVPLVFAGCKSNASLQSVYEKTVTIAKNQEISEFFKKSAVSKFENGITVTYSSNILNQKLADTSSSIYILKNVYEPMLEIACDFYIATHSSFKMHVDAKTKLDISQAELNTLYENLENLESSLVDFKHAKTSFEQQETGAGHSLGEFLMYYNKLLQNLYSFSTNYANIYMSRINSFVDFTNKDLVFKSENVIDAKLYYSYSKTLLGNIAFKYYLDNYSLQADPDDRITVSEWRAKYTYIDELIKNHALYKTKLMTIDVNNNGAYAKVALGDFLRLKTVFAKDTGLFEKTLQSFNFKKYFTSTNPELYVAGLDKVQKAYFDFAQNYLDYHFASQVKWLNRILNLMN